MHRIRYAAVAAVFVVGALIAGGCNATSTPQIPTSSPAQPYSFSVTPLSAAFDNQTVSTTSAAKTVTIKNTGTTAQLVLPRMNGLNFADFAQTNNCPPVAIAPGASCTFSVTFTPSASGNRVGVLVIDGTVDDEAFVGLTGTGI